METQINITFTDGKFEKSMEANSLQEAVEVATNSNNFPIEIADYKTMRVVLSDTDGKAEFSYEEINKKTISDYLGI